MANMNPPSASPKEPFSGRGVGQVDFQHTSLKRTRSRKQRRMQEMEEKQRIRGDCHWSKILQVNAEDPSWFAHKRGTRMCRSFHFGHRSSFRTATSSGSGSDHGESNGAASCNSSRGSSPKRSPATPRQVTRLAQPPASETQQRAPEPGFIASIFSRVRQWLGSKRRYEVSPGVNDDTNNENKMKDGGVRVGKKGRTGKNGRKANGLRRGSAGKDDCHVINKIPNYNHRELKRSDASNTLGNNVIANSKSASAIYMSSDPTTPLHTKQNPQQQTLHANMLNKGSKIPSKLSSVDINIEFVDTTCSIGTPVELRSHIRDNPLKLRQHGSSSNSKKYPVVMTPSSRMLSRSQQLRQSRNKYMKLLQKTGQLSPGRSPLTGTISAPAKHDLSRKPSTKIIRRRINTWPLPRKSMRSDDDDPFVGDSEVELPFIQEMMHEKGGFRSKSSLKDFSISFDDLTLGELSKRGRRCKLYKGRWHGDIIVHVFGELRQKDKDAFWANLGKLCRIRHENIILFMAACTTPPNLAVVTCNPQGKSLYDHIHCQREKMTLHTKIGVLRQIAQGMGYLHAKGIVLRKLNTKNVFIGHKVKVSAMDYGFPDAAKDRLDYGCVPRGHLTYIAPEILCTIRVMPPRLVPFAAFSTESDVFAFGTIMYEVLSGQFPFHNLPAEQIIWQVCVNQRKALFSFKCNVAIKTLIEDCWAHEPLYRPEFRELCKDLQRHSPLHKKHSSSEPKGLNKSFDLDT